MTNPYRTYLGILAAPTAEGPKVVALAIAGAVELYHFVDEGLDTSTGAVQDWLWNAGINPAELAAALPPEVLLETVVVPAIDRRSVVIQAGDADIPFVLQLQDALRASGADVRICGIDLKSTMEAASHGVAVARADALRDRYEAAVACARLSPEIHKIDGEIDEAGALKSLSISGILSQQSWTIENDASAMFKLTALTHLGDLAVLEIASSPAAAKIRAYVDELGIGEFFYDAGKIGEI